jgi:metal-dependent amidase/aminoacylase/carboxypeptidase family protein
MINAAKTFDVHLKMKRDSEWCYPAWERNDLELIKLAEETWREMRGNTVVRPPFGEMGTDDDVYMMNEITKNGGKCIYSLLVSDAHAGAPFQYGELHTDKMNVDDELMIAGVNLTIKMIEKILENKS